MKKLVALTLALSVIITLTGGAFAAAETPSGAARFTDVSASAWYFPYVDRLTKEGTILGVSADRFAPASYLSRCEFVTMVIRSTVGDLPAPPNDSHWAQNYMEKAYALGITDTDESPDYIWDDPIRRQDMAKIITRTTELIQKETPVEDAESFIPRIADYDELCKACKPYILQAYAKGILTGMDSKGTFNGTGLTTRGEAACVVVKLIDLKYRAEWYDGIAFSPATDVNDTGTMKIATAEKFIMKTLENTRFTKENGKYYVSCTYPELPEGFEVFFGSTVEFTNKSVFQAKTTAIKERDLIPNIGGFKKEITGMTSLSGITFVSLSVSIKAPNAITIGYQKYECMANIKADYSSGALTKLEQWLDFVIGDYKDMSLNYSDIFKW